MKNKQLQFKRIVLAACLLALSACQLNDQFRSYDEKHITTNISSLDFGQYYLSLKTLTTNELMAEIQKQKQFQAIANGSSSGDDNEANSSVGSHDATIKMILLYSLPESPIYNAYTAKSLLNEYFRLQQTQLEQTHLSMPNEAFIHLLKDQLNQQIYLFQKLLSQDISEEAHKKHSLTLERKVAQLEQKIQQLKKIEKSISNHE